MRRIRISMEPNSNDSDRKPPGLPVRVLPPRVPKRAGPPPPPPPPPRVPKRVGPPPPPPPRRGVFPRTVFEEVAQASTSASSSSSSDSGSSAGPSAAQGARHRDRDRELIYNWLRQILFHEYTDSFLDAGYDLPTIARMTPADLAGIGIRQPAHRRHLKQHIDALVLPDALPRHVPATIEKWLRYVRLDEYLPVLLGQGFRTVQDVTALAWDDLEELGIVRLGHQKRMLLAIERVKDIVSGKLACCTVSEEAAEPRPIELVTITWRPLASVTRALTPPDGPHSACSTFRSDSPPRGAYALLADLSGPRAGEAEEEEEGAAALPAPALEEINSTCVLDNVERMLAVLVQQLDTMYEDEKDDDD